MEVIRADTAGFCMGVSLALRKLDEQVGAEDTTSSLHTLGPIIHNPQVLDEYAAKGVQKVDDPDQIASGGRVIIRAHGVPLLVESRLKRLGARVVDATCPKVKRAQMLIQEQTNQGRRMLLFGEQDHPEVRGLLSYASEDAVVFDTEEALENLDLPSDTQWFLAAQTTQDKEAFSRVEQALRERLDPDIPVLHTICDATRERQAEALTIARCVDAMVVVGGYSSGNTRRLANVVSDEGVYCVHVETPEELPLEELRKFKKVGLTAGASTPRNIIDAVEQKLAELT